jgi:hypothetical protein
MLNVTIEPIMLSVIVLDVVILNVVAPNERLEGCFSLFL